MKNTGLHITLLLLLTLAACGHKEAATNNKSKKVDPASAYRKNVMATVKLVCYDQYTYEAEKPTGALVGGNLVATTFNPIQGAYSVRAKLLGTNVEPMMNGYFAYDIPGNLILLKLSGPPVNHPKLAKAVALGDSLYSLEIKNGKILKKTVLCDSTIFSNDKTLFRLKNASSIGIPVFNEDHKIAGITTEIKVNGVYTAVLYTVQELNKLIESMPKKVEHLGNLRFKTDKIYAAPETVDYFRIVTTLGSFDLKIYDDLPEYKANFIRLCTDSYYDSLLVHRVLNNFLIQMGASDTRHALPDDPVGWKGPGYTLPMVVIPEYFHKRGAVAASKLPDYKNPRNRSDGSQFYVISGRIFTSEELNDLESQMDMKFTPEQRKIYETVGGAPYLDGDYTVFGEIIRGMDVVDAIAAVPTKNDARPLTDIRIKNIEMVMK